MSDGIGGVLADGVIALEGKHEKFIESENVRRSRELLIKRRDELMQRSDAVVKRIFKAFPNLKNGDIINFSEACRINSKENKTHPCTG